MTDHLSGVDDQLNAMRRSVRTTWLPGTRSVSHLEENLAAAKIELDDRDLATLDELQQRN
jgi:aryl-alcohol dehydrogenase-like predicted oxidoreductase